MAFIGLALEGGRVRSAGEVEIRDWLNSHEWVAVDTETDGLTWDARVRMVQFGDTETGYAVSVTEPEGSSFVVDALMKFRGRLVFHNAPFDIRRLHQLGLDPDYVWPRAENTMVMAHVLSPTEMNYGLKELSHAWGVDLNAKDSRVGLKERMRKHNLKSRHATVQWNWGTVPRLVLAPYAINDPILTAKLYVHIERQLTAADWKVIEKEYEAAQAVAEVSYKGMRLDREYAEALNARWLKEMAEEERWFLETWGIDNPNADAQLIEVLLGQGWIPRVFTKKSKKPQLNKAVKAELVGRYDVIDHLNHYKRIGKWRSAYVENCLEEAARDGRVHAQYKSLGAKTGRMSCSQPPLQQLPKGGGGEVRRLFIASEGNLICSVDYSQIEMRLAGHFAQDPYLMEAYRQGRDIYQEMSDFISETVPCTRPQGKIASLAALYGSKGKSIALALGTDPATSVAIVSEFWRMLPVLNKWAVSVTNQAKSGGSVTSRWGRRLKPHAPYAAGNAIIQGTAAEVMKEGILRMAEARLLPYVVGIVHDEVVLDVPESDAEAITDKVVSLLEDHSFTIPLTTEGKVYGHSWGDGYAVT